MSGRHKLNSRRRSEGPWKTVSAAATQLLRYSSDIFFVPVRGSWTKAGGLTHAHIFASYRMDLRCTTICFLVLAARFTQAAYGLYGNPGSTTTPSTTVTSNPNNSVSVASLQEPLNNFAFQLYNQILATNPTVASDNLFYSPTSIVSALMLVYAGAKGDTKTELTSAFGLQSQVNQGADILSSFQSIINIFRPGPVINGTVAYDLSLANRAYIEQTFNVLASYISAITTKLNSTVGLVDFINNSEAARSGINQWVSQQTNNKITDLLPPDSVNGLTRLVLVNAIYFKAAWANEFDERMTFKGEFRNLDRTTSQVDMMSKSKETLLYLDTAAETSGTPAFPAFQMLSIPYKSNQLSLLIFLPRDVGGLRDLETSFGASGGVHIAKFLSEAKNQSIDRLSLPKFTIKLTLHPKKALQQVGSPGIKTLFDPDAADLTGISAVKPLFVSDIIHQAFIEVNERGTEAAAATAILVSTASFPVNPINFVADHPFLFAIRDEQSGLIIFMGRVAKM